MYCPHCTHLNLPGSDQCARCLFDLSSIDRPAPQDKIDASLMTDAVQALAPRPAVTVPATATLGEALTRMIDRGVGAILVTDDLNRLAGILTERDYLDKIAGREAFESLATTDFMTRDPETLTPTDPLAFALRKM